MALPSGGADPVLDAIAAAFRDRAVWPAGTTDADKRHQRAGVQHHYLYAISGGFALSELGAREIAAGQGRRGADPT
jgi:hypothetical protein